jgi:hypothetical protein
MFVAIATTLAGVGAFLWSNIRRAREARVLRVARPVRPGRVPVWAQATSIVATSASALLLLLREKP